jgi:hypothetical protein
MNLLLITDRLIETGKIEQLEKNYNIKILYYFGPEFDLSSLNDFSWADQIVAEDRLIDEIQPTLKVDIYPLSTYLTFTSHDQHSPHKNRVGLAGEVQIRPQGNVLFVPCNDTHVKMFVTIAQEVGDRSFLVIPDENADVYLDMYDEEYWTIEPKLFKENEYRSPIIEELKNRGTKIVVFANDWSPENRKICRLAREMRIPTVCIQEGPQDFELDGGKWQQMQQADYVFAQGPITLCYLEAKYFIITGNPRLSSYLPVPLPNRPMVMINSNFTYNVYEDWRERWVRDCVRACNRLGVSYFISQHPRDNGAFEKYNVIKSGAFKIVDQIKKASIVITRFSQVLYEAMLMGRPVIYYNPHGEVKRVLTDDSSGAFSTAASPKSLKKYLRKATENVFPDQRERGRFLKLHCGPGDGRETERCLIGLAHISNGVIQQPNHDIYV